MTAPEEQNLTSLLAASQNGDAESVAEIWRDLTPAEQEGVLFALLGLQTAITAAGISVDPRDRPDLLLSRLDEAPGGASSGATEVVSTPSEPGVTELIPKAVEDLRGLTASENDEAARLVDGPVLSDGASTYRARWLHRWKGSALASALAVTILFAFTGDVSSYGPMEWGVAIFATVVGGGLLVGTLVNFVAAAISTPRRHPDSEQG